MFRRLTIIIGLWALVGSIASPVFVMAAANRSDGLTVHLQSDTGFLPPEVIPSDPGGQSGSYSPSNIFNVSVSTTDTTATVNWSTSELTLGRLSWGTTAEYNMGNIYAEQYKKSHSILITGLESKKRYYFKITAVNLGYVETYFNGEFVTSSSVLNAAPENVSQFFASSNNDHITLSWNNPVDPNFESVKIVRSEKFFPLDPLNGKTIYESNGMGFEDFAVTPGTIYYYTAFTKYKNGKFSSGAITSSMIVWFSEGNGIDGSTRVVDLQLPFAQNALSQPHNFSDIILAYSDGRIIDSNNPIIEVGEELHAIFPDDKVPRDSSFMTLSVKDDRHNSTDSTYLFLYDKESKQYIVQIPAFKKDQPYKMVVTVFNSSKLIIEKINGTVKTVHASEGEDNAGEQSEPMRPGIILIVFLAVGSAIALTFRFLKVTKISSQ